MTIEIVRQGRLSARDLAVMARVESQLYMRPSIRVLAIVLSVVLMGYSAVRAWTAESSFGWVPFVCVFWASAALLDSLGLKFVRSWLQNAFARGAPETLVASFGEGGILLYPAGDPTKHVSLGWSLVDLLVLPEGIFLVGQRPRTIIVYLPGRDLTSEDRTSIEALGQSAGARILKMPNPAS